jgi:hypothetical protein
MQILNPNYFFPAVGVGLVLVIFAVFSIWSHKFGLQAVKSWAAAKSLQVVSVRRRTFVPLVPHWRSLPTRSFQFFRVTVCDRNGANHKAWMRLESDCTNPEVIEVIWDDKNLPD